MLKILAPAAALACLAGAAIAAPNTATVKLAGLDANNPADARVMEKRIETAALEACGADDGSLRLVKRSAQKSDCYKQALEQTRAAVARQLAAN